MKPLKIGVLLLVAYTLSLGGGEITLAAGQGAPSAGNIEPLSAAGLFGEDWSVMLGAKIWSNEWDLPLEYRSMEKTYILEYESETELTYIPAILVRYRNFFVGGSFLIETDYSFSAQQIMEARWYNDTESWSHAIWNQEVSGSRTEWDMNIGYFLTPNIAVSVGYKTLDRDVTITGISYFNENYYNSSTYPLSAHAPIIGVSAAAPVGNRINLYGNLAYGWLGGDASYRFYQDGELDSNEMELEGEYTFAELGLSYVIPLQQKIASAISIGIGYRFQRLDMTLENKEGIKSWGKSGDQHDATAGFVFGVSASL